MERLKSYIAWLEEGHAIDVDECLSYLRDALITEQTYRTYEDTGLTPERCAELAQADKEGRLMCLAVKSNNTVHAIENGKICEVFISEVVESYTAKEGIEYQGFYADECEDFSFKPSDIGKTVFLSHEAALEAAGKE